MFKRKITDEIYKWKKSTGKKKALVIKGMNPFKVKWQEEMRKESCWRDTEMGSVMGREEKDHEETGRNGICNMSYDWVDAGEDSKSKYG